MPQEPPHHVIAASQPTTPVQATPPSAAVDWNDWVDWARVQLQAQGLGLTEAQTVGVAKGLFRMGNINPTPVVEAHLDFNATLQQVRHV
jgi:hypothetical protein